MARMTIGRVAPIFRDEYNVAVEYSNFDMVTSDGNLYMYINTIPSTSNLLNDTNYWKLVAEKGEKGEKGDQGDQGIKGDTGNIHVCTFYVDIEIGELMMVEPDGYNGPIFRINNITGNLEVVIDG